MARKQYKNSKLIYLKNGLIFEYPSIYLDSLYISENPYFFKIVTLFYKKKNKFHFTVIIIFLRIILKSKNPTICLLKQQYKSLTNT